MPAQRTTWLVTPDVTVAGTDYLGQTPAESLTSMGSLLVRIGGYLHTHQQTEGLVLVDEAAAARIGLSEPATDDGTRQRALDTASAAGYRSTAIGPYTSFFANGRPTIHVGRVEVIAGTAQTTDPSTWPWGTVWHPDITAGLQHWHRLTGVAWQSGPAVMGLEVMHRTLKPYRVAGVKGQRRPDLRDDSTPHDATEAVWSLEMWSRTRKGKFIHGYDKRRAGLTAAGVAKLSPCKLTRRRGVEFDPKRAGWWEVTVSPWGLGNQLPHPMGPAAMQRYRKSMWVTTATLDLCSYLADEGVLSMPEVIDSLTGPARPVLAPFQQTLEATYSAPVDDDYPEAIRLQVRDAVKESAARGIGMLNKADGKSSIWRPDWYGGINATKRANSWRKAWAVGQEEQRWPVGFVDDCILYASDDPDPLRAAPKALRALPGDRTDETLTLDIPGAYRIQGTVDSK